MKPDPLSIEAQYTIIELTDKSIVKTCSSQEDAVSDAEDKNAIDARPLIVFKVCRGKPMEVVAIIYGSGECELHMLDD